MAATDAAALAPCSGNNGGSGVDGCYNLRFPTSNDSGSAAGAFVLSPAAPTAVAAPELQQAYAQAYSGPFARGPLPPYSYGAKSTVTREPPPYDGSVAFVSEHGEESQPRPPFSAAEAAEKTPLAAKEALAEDASRGCWDVRGYYEAAPEGLLYSATLAAVSLDVTHVPWSPSEKSLIAAVKLPELGSHASDYPVPPALLLEEALKQQEDRQDAAAAAAKLLQQQPQPLPRVKSLAYATGLLPQDSSNKPATPSKSIDPASIFSLPLAHRRALLFNMLANFCIEANAGKSTCPQQKQRRLLAMYICLSLLQLTSNRDLVSVFVRLSDDLQHLLLDMRTGHVLEFPLVHAEAVYTLQRRRVPVIQATDSGQPQNLPPQQQNTPHEEEERRPAATIAAEGGCSEERNYIVVLEFGCKKLAFAFADRINAETFQLAAGLLARRAKEVQQLSSRSTLASLVDSIPFTPRAAKEFLEHLAAPPSPRFPPPSSSSSGRVGTSRLPQQHRQQASALREFVQQSAEAFSCGCWGFRESSSTSRNACAPARERSPGFWVFGTGAPLPPAVRGGGQGPL
ncbi:hypothetical protein cyc_08594 [Cyclospora cayetanensis]|uniref:Uncharacterized protein n=1 Tax=Cyclospora cayetanensis TaxID=88456 RepID=A0A1D3CZB1_9EIME|nr:hypothetical protein cyc_08594 [Cyclospora cayetanensis]